MSTRFPAVWRERTERLLAARFAAGPLPGAAAMVWADGEPVLEWSGGERAPGVAMGVDAILSIASMTKPVVSLAALQLVDEGALRLEDPISTWIPELAEVRVLEDPAGPLNRTRRARGPIRVDDLLTHRAGYGYAFLEEGPIATEYDRVVGSVLATALSPDEWLARLAELPLLDEPGARFRYGHATDVLGCVVARIDGTTLGESLRRRVFEPLGMTDTGFAVPDDRRSRLAVPVEHVPAEPPPFEAGGGGLFSTAPDYLRFARLILGAGELDGTRLLAPATAATMLRNHLPAEVRALPAIGRPDFFAHSGFGYGVGVVLDRMGPGTPFPGAVNWKGIFGTWWRADPAAGVAAVLMTHEPADITSASGPRNTVDLTPAGMLQGVVETAVYEAVDAAVPEAASHER